MPTGMSIGYTGLLPLYRLRRRTSQFWIGKNAWQNYGIIARNKCLHPRLLEDLAYRRHYRKSLNSDSLESGSLKENRFGLVPSKPGEVQKLEYELPAMK